MLERTPGPSWGNTGSDQREVVLGARFDELESAGLAFCPDVFRGPNAGTCQSCKLARPKQVDRMTGGDECQCDIITVAVKEIVKTTNKHRRRGQAQG